MDASESSENRSFPVKEWVEIFLHANERIGAHNLSLISAGVAFFSMLALFPAIAATISLYGYFSDPVAVETNLQLLQPILPEQVYRIVYDQVHSLLATSSSTLQITSILSILLAVWSARAGVLAMITGLNVVYRVQTRRNFFRRLINAYLLTFVLIGTAIISISSVVIIPTIASFFPLGGFAGVAVQLLRWTITLVAILLSIGILYRFGPNIKTDRVRYISVGAAVAAVLWIIVSSLFSFYLTNFGQYNQVYGSLGAVIAMLIWFYLTAWVVFLGAELNAEIAHHRKHGPGNHELKGTS